MKGSLITSDPQSSPEKETLLDKRASAARSLDLAQLALARANSIAAPTAALPSYRSALRHAEAVVDHIKERMERIERLAAFHDVRRSNDNE